MSMYDPFHAKVKAAFYTAAAALMGLGIASTLGWSGPSYRMPVIGLETQIPIEAVQPALDLSDAFVNVAETVTPAVVRIAARRQAPAAGSQRSRPLRPDQNPRDRPDRISGGSGFIISDDGYILTNNHVVDGADVLTVFLADRRSFPAEVVGRDPFTDVAVIKIDAANLTRLNFGSSADLRVGEWIVAIGNPGFGGASTPLDYTVTVGIVSALGRPLQLLRRGLAENEETSGVNPGFAIEDFIQTDAVINPGNSGGPMVNLRGQVVGINSAIASQSGYYQGYGFAIPIDLAHRVMEDLVEYGQVRRAWLGVAMRQVDDVSAESYGLPTVSGVELTLITPGGPSEAHGLRVYDVIVAIDGQPIGRSGQLQQAIAMKRPGDRISVGIYRDGEPLTVNIRLGEAPLQSRSEVVAAAAPVREEARMDDKLGLRIENMDRTSAREFGFEEVDGVVITDVQVNGPAALRGVPPGTKLIELNRETIKNSSDVRRIMAGVNPGEIVTLHVADRNDNRQILHVRVSR